jgi:hypothetical protein
MLVFAQVLLSTDDLKGMMEEVSGTKIGDGDDPSGGCTIDLRTFLLIMQYSSW